MSDQFQNQEIISKHKTYSQSYHTKDAALRYQKKFDRSWHAKVGAWWEMKLTIKALTHAGRLIKKSTGKSLSELTVLDYPCGAGRLAKMFATRVAGYVAGDHSPYMVELTSTLLEQAGLQDKLIATTVGDVKESDLEDQSVDLAACMRLLHHFPLSEDRINILKEFHRVSRHALIVTYHDADSIKQKRYIKKRKRLGKPCTRVILTEKEFADEASQAGWHLAESWQVSSISSGLCIALLQRQPTS